MEENLSKISGEILHKFSSEMVNGANEKYFLFKRNASGTVHKIKVSNEILIKRLDSYAPQTEIIVTVNDFDVLPRIIEAVGIYPKIKPSL